MSSNLLKKYGFNEAEFQSLQAAYRSGELSLQSNLINYGNSWRVRPPLPSDSVDFPSPVGRESERGREIIAAGRLGLIFMNGGAATRFQKPGENLPKGAFPIMELKGRERSFMELKIANARAAEKEFGGRIPAWILNSYFTEERTREILKESADYGKDHLYTYCQGIMKRVIPSEADLRLHYGKAVGKLEKKIGKLPPGEERAEAEKEKEELEANLTGWIGELAGRAGDELDEAAGKDRYNPPGHLDTTLWLILDRSRPLLKMLDLGVEYLMISNIDNLGALVDSALPGLLSIRREAGAGILCEVSVKPPGQKGGALARVYDPERDREWCQLIEEFAFPLDFDQDRIPEFNNAAYTVAVADLLRIFGLNREELAGGSREALADRVRAVTDRLPVYVAIKELKRPGQPPLPVVQFERLQGDLTRLLQPLAVKTEDRFFPVKKREDIPTVVPRLQQVLSGRVLLSNRA
ncbi:MAG: UTP--glucose-1-phosphate uridylyltransferase [Candidatus Erginobacter occultus]|nr:UTP--glucose-1-phosphate uridylyltransferase [Candidatus Erginobacter occultus]